MGQDFEKWRGIFPYNPLQLESASPAHYFWSQISCGVLPWFQSSCSFCTHTAWCIRSMSSTWEWKTSKCTLYHLRVGNNYGGWTDLGKAAWTFAPNWNVEFWRFAKIWLIFLPLSFNGIYGFAALPGFSWVQKQETEISLKRLFTVFPAG